MYLPPSVILPEVFYTNGGEYYYVSSGINYATVYSNASGVATSYVYGWVAPGSTTEIGRAHV